MSNWTTILTADELKTYFFNFDSNNLRRSKANQDWWMARSLTDLEARRHGAWMANDGETWMLTSSLIANFDNFSAKFQAKQS